MTEEKTQKNFWIKFRKMWTVSRFFAILLGFVGLAGLLPVSWIEGRLLPPYWDDFLKNISPELIGIAIVVLVVDYANEQRATQHLKDSLILQMGGPSNEFARQAIRQMRVRAWIEDGSLNGKSFWRADLREAELSSAKMIGVNLGGANLEGANLNGSDLRAAEFHDSNLNSAHLVKADLRDAEIYTLNLKGADLFGADLTGARFMALTRSGGLEDPNRFLHLVFKLQLATMPWGSRYDGRYNLPGDLMKAEIKYDLNNPVEMAHFYRVSKEEYLEGQKWYEENANKWRFPRI